MSQFDWTRNDLSLKSRDVAFMGAKQRRRVAKRLLGMAFADLTPVAASMAYTGSATNNALSNAAVSAGQLLAKDASGNWGPADTDLSLIAAGGNGLAIALSTCAATGQPIVILADGNSGTINLGCTVIAGAIYIGSSVAGKIYELPDATHPTTGWFTSIVGIGISATFVQLILRCGGVAHA